MNKLYKYFFLGLVALPLAGFTGGVVSSEKAYAATKSPKKGSSANFYGRLWVQYDTSDNSTSSNQKLGGLRDDEGMGRFGVKGKSTIGNGYAVNYKVEYAIDIGDGIATGDSKDCSSSTACRTFNLKQGWLGLLTPYGQLKFGSMESPYKYMAKHDILHDTITQARDTRMISQGSMSHSSYWRESMYYDLKMGDLKIAAIYGFGEGTSNSTTNKDKGFGIEYKNLVIPGFDVVYAYNKDESKNDENKKTTFTYTMKMADKNKVKVWYMHEDVGLDTKLFTSTGDGEVDWYGINYKTGPMTLQYSYSETDADRGSDYDRDGYNIGLQYKLSKTSRVYLGYSSSEAGKGDGALYNIKSTMIGLRHDF